MCAVCAQSLKSNTSASAPLNSCAIDCEYIFILLRLSFHRNRDLKLKFEVVPFEHFSYFVLFRICTVSFNLIFVLRQSVVNIHICICISIRGSLLERGRLFSSLIFCCFHWNFHSFVFRSFLTFIALYPTTQVGTNESETIIICQNNLNDSVESKWKKKETEKIVDLLMTTDSWWTAFTHRNWRIKPYFHQIKQHCSEQTKKKKEIFCKFEWMLEKRTAHQAVVGLLFKSNHDENEHINHI